MTNTKGKEIDFFGKTNIRVVGRDQILQEGGGTKYINSMKINVWVTVILVSQNIWRVHASVPPGSHVPELSTWIIYTPAIDVLASSSLVKVWGGFSVRFGSFQGWDFELPKMRYIKLSAK